MERLQRPEGVNISKGRVRVECVEQSHVAAENTGEHWRLLRMKFYVTVIRFIVGTWRMGTLTRAKTGPWTVVM